MTKHHLENKEETQKQTLSESNRWWFSLRQCRPDLTAKLAQAPDLSGTRKLEIHLEVYGVNRDLLQKA